jgi:hypothetical protein
MILLTNGTFNDNMIFMLEIMENELVLIFSSLLLSFHLIANVSVFQAYGYIVTTDAIFFT